jgi:uncharacterized protein (DUF1778 family)
MVVAAYDKAQTVLLDEIFFRLYEKKFREFAAMLATK